MERTVRSVLISPPADDPTAGIDSGPRKPFIMTIVKIDPLHCAWRWQQHFVQILAPQPGAAVVLAVW